MPQDETDTEHSDSGYAEADLNHRERATLRAVSRGDAEITCSSEPDLFLDGLACCDQGTAHRLARAGLIAPAYAGRPGQRVPAVLTDAGQRALAPSLVGN
ncbi:hypothetical protein [Saccharomonospora saliphila]|uniref:hypothetical protein n=1 Tax=Saccharomonospora saliphila TaxID=369829 RepID=UPI00036E7040|nr:hypothetical protein [Saccharomonospora saliphila]